MVLRRIRWQIQKSCLQHLAASYCHLLPLLVNILNWNINRPTLKTIETETSGRTKVITEGPKHNPLSVCRMFMYMYMYMHMHMNMCMHIYVYIYIYNAYRYLCLCLPLRLRLQVSSYLNIHVYLHAHACACICVFIVFACSCYKCWYVYIRHDDMYKSQVAARFHFSWVTFSKPKPLRGLWERTSSELWKHKFSNNNCGVLPGGTQKIQLHLWDLDCSHVSSFVFNFMLSSRLFHALQFKIVRIAPRKSSKCWN